MSPHLGFCSQTVVIDLPVCPAGGSNLKMPSKMQSTTKAGLSSTATKSNVKANATERRTLPGAHKPKEQPVPSTFQILKAAAKSDRVKLIISFWKLRGLNRKRSMMTFLFYADSERIFALKFKWGSCGQPHPSLQTNSRRGGKPRNANGA